MKSVYVSDIKGFKNGTQIEEIFMIKKAEVREKKDGDSFVALTLSDKTGSISAMDWNCLAKGFTGDTNDLQYVKVGATCTMFKDTVQLRIETISAVADTDSINRDDFLHSAPEQPEEMYNYVVSKLNEIENPNIKKLTLSIYESDKEKLLYYPAASGNHHAYYAGLLYHVKRMMMTAEAYVKVYPLLDKDYLYAGVALHDIGKLIELDSSPVGGAKYTVAGNLLGHITLGVNRIALESQKVGLSNEEKMLLEHMILSHHYEPEFGSPVKPLFPEAEALHHLDIMDGKINSFEEQLAELNDGSLSSPVFSLENRRIYKKGSNN